MCWASGAVSFAADAGADRGPGKAVALRIAFGVSMALYLQELREVLLILGAERKIQIMPLRDSP